MKTLDARQERGRPRRAVPVVGQLKRRLETAWGTQGRRGEMKKTPETRTSAFPHSETVTPVTEGLPSLKH